MATMRCAIKRPASRCTEAEHGARCRREPICSPAALDRAEQLFRALGDVPRLRILQLLAEGEWCVTELVTTLAEKFPTVSQRLRILRDKGLVRRRRDGTHIYYALADRHVADLIHHALAHAQELASEPPAGHDSPDEGD